MGTPLSKLKLLPKPLLRMAAPRPKLRILCFGDSLTAGYASWGAVHHPYEGRMAEMLAMAFPDLAVETEEDGVSGATVKSGFLTRMNSQCGLLFVCLLFWVLCVMCGWVLTQVGVVMSSKARKREGEKVYDWAVVLGGTKYVALSP